MPCVVTCIGNGDCADHPVTRRLMRSWSWAVLASAAVLGPLTVSAQKSTSKITTGVIVERVTFTGGVLESDLAGADSSRVMSATNLAVPVQYSTVVGGVWLLDAGASFSSGTRKVSGTSASDDALSGISDIRVRASRRFDRLGLRITVGANIPTGVTKLDRSQTAALSVLGSPAINMTQPAVGFGAGATLGIVKSFAAASKQWGVALGTSVEWRGQYDPFAALAVGAAVNSYDPGEVVRVSAGATRLFGESKGLITASLDLFGADKVSRGTNTKPVEIQIGPTVALDAQFMPATTTFKNTALFGALRLRSALKRDGTELAKSGNVMFEAGARAAKPLTSHVDAVFEVSGRVLTAVAIDNRLATAASTSVAPIFGLAINGADWTLQPMLTARIGSVDTGIGKSSFTVLGGRLMLERRF